MFPLQLCDFPPGALVSPTVPPRHAGQADLRLTFLGINMIMFPCFSRVMDWWSFAFLSFLSFSCWDKIQYDPECVSVSI